MEDKIPFIGIFLPGKSFPESAEEILSKNPTFSKHIWRVDDLYYFILFDTTKIKKISPEIESDHIIMIGENLRVYFNEPAFYTRSIEHFKIHRNQFDAQWRRR